MKPSLIITGLIALVLVFSCKSPGSQSANPSAAGISENRIHLIDTMLKAAVDSGWIDGAVALVARNGKLAYYTSVGYNDAEAKTPLPKDEIFRIASQTKAITSAAVMILFDEGKLLLDDPVSKYIPEFAHMNVLDKFNEKDTTYTTVPANREITLRDLLTHTSGIDYPGIGTGNMQAIYAKSDIPVGFEGRPILLGERMKKLAKLPLVHQPGERFTYGLNCDLLGYVVEVVSGKTLDQFMHERIFEPLGMNDTYFYIPADKHSRLAAVHTEKNKKAVQWNDSIFKGLNVNYPLVKGTYFSGGAGLSSTIADYARFLQMMLNGGELDGKRILSRKAVELMTSNQIGKLDLGEDKFGLGFEITSETSQARFGMSKGSFAWGGFWGTTYWADPKEKLICLLFCQQWPVSHGEINDKFHTLVYSALE